MRPFREFLSELKRRHVYRVAIAYGVVAWFVVQAASIVVPELLLPEWMTRATIIVVILGFPLALLLAWAYDITPDGMQRTDSGEPAAPNHPDGAASGSGRRLRRIRLAMAAAAGVIVIAIGLAYAVAGGAARHVLRGDALLDISGETRLLTTLDGFERFPAISPDGRFVVFRWNNGSGDSLKLFIVPASGGTPEPLSGGTGQEMSPTWSPDGHSIAFLRARADAPAIKDIMIKPVMGGPARRIASAHIFEGLDWSPDGTWLAVSDFPQAPGAPPCDYISCPPAIHLVSVETGIAHQISFPPDTGRAVREDTDPVFSPDGTHVAFVRHNRGGGFQGIVHVQPIDGSREARQISRGRSAWDVDWTPDGRAIIVASGAPSNRRLLRYPLAGGEPDTLAVGTGALDVSVARKAGVLVYAEHYQNHDLWRVPGPAAATGAAPERLSGSTRDEFMPSHSPDGRRLAFISARSGDWEVWVSDADGRNELQLTSLGQALFPIWSPDGRAVFFSSTAPKIRAELSDVFVVDANGGRPRNLTEDEKLDAIPGLSLDGAWLYYQSNPGSTGWELWRKPIEGGDAERLTGSDALRPHAATDGRVYFSRAGLGIWSVPATGGDWRQVIAEPVVWNQWTIWRNTVVYLMHDDSTTTFRVHNVETGTDTVLHTIPAQTLRGAPSPGATLTLSVSPDGQWIVYSALDRMGSDLKIVNAIR